MPYLLNCSQGLGRATVRDLKPGDVVVYEPPKLHDAGSPIPFSERFVGALGVIVPNEECEYTKVDEDEAAVRWVSAPKEAAWAGPVLKHYKANLRRIGHVPV